MRIVSCDSWDLLWQSGRREGVVGTIVEMNERKAMRSKASGRLAGPQTQVADRRSWLRAV